MKKASLLTALTLGGLMACVAPALAQDNKPDKPPGEGRPGPRGGGQRMDPQERLDRMTKELNLSDDQKSKVKELFQGEAEKGREIRQDSNLSPEEKREKMQAIREAGAAKMKNILTKEQFEKWQKLQEEMRQRMQERGGRPPGGPGDAPAKKSDKD